MLDFSIIVIILFLGFYSKNFYGEVLDKKDKKVLNILWFYHVAICIIFYLYSMVNSSDARNYWFTVKENLSTGFLDYLSLGFGTYFMYALNYFPSKILDLSYFTGSLIYAYIGYLGFILLYIIFSKKIKYNSRIFNIKLFPLILFLPNLHFWSAGVGKDTLLFFCIAYFFYAMLRPKKHIIGLMLVLLLSYLVRPHITVFLLFSFGIGIMLEGKLKPYQKVFFISVIIVGFALMFNSILNYLRLESLNLETITEFSQDRSAKLSRDYTGSSIDISSYSFPAKVFTFLYRPLFFDINGALAILSSFENLFILILSLFLLIRNPFKLFFKADYFFKSLSIFFIIGTVSFSLILGNLGIMLRQKNMFIPALLFLCLWAFSYIIEKEVEEIESQETKQNLKN